MLAVTPLARSRRRAARGANERRSRARNRRRRPAGISRHPVWRRHRPATIHAAAAARTLARSCRRNCVRRGEPAAGSEANQSEDCLFLNVTAPIAKAAKPRPVIVYIHGGAYSSGSGSSPLYDGSTLCRRGDVVVVTVNHRLSLFGYLYLPGFPDSGNAGMLDLVLALRWVRDNIAAFGGDPDCVTLLGQSGGGAKIATLMAMPAASGLFHRAATMSGQQLTASGPLHAAGRTRALLDKLGVPSDRAATLASLPAADLLRAHAGTVDPYIGRGSCLHGTGARRAHAHASSVLSGCAAAVRRHSHDDRQHPRRDALADRARRSATPATSPGKRCRSASRQSCAWTSRAHWWSPNTAGGIRSIRRRTCFSRRPPRDVRGAAPSSRRNCAPQQGSPAFAYQLDWGSPARRRQVGRIPHARHTADVRHADRARIADRRRRRGAPRVGRPCSRRCWRSHAPATLTTPDLRALGAVHAAAARDHGVRRRKPPGRRSTRRRASAVRQGALHSAGHLTLRGNS